MTLPKLPRSKYTGMQHQRCYIGIVYTQEQMRAYAEKAVADEREACVRLVWDTPEPEDEYTPLREAIANAIRARSNT